MVSCKAVRATATKTGWDLVLIPRGRVEIANYHELQASVAGLLSRARILADKDGVKGIGSTVV